MLLWTYLLYVVYSIYAKMLSKEKNDIRFTICTFTPIESVPYVVEVYQISFLQLYYVPISCLMFLLFSFLFFFELRTYIFLNGLKHASKSTWIHREFFDQENKILMDCFPFLFMDYYWCIIVICWNYNYWRFSKYFNILI